MTTIKCPTCGKDSTYEFTPKTQTSPFDGSSTISSVSLKLSCGDEFPIISLAAITNLYNVVGMLNDKINSLENQLKTK